MPSHHTSNWNKMIWVSISKRALFVSRNARVIHLGGCNVECHSVSSINCLN